MTVLIQPLRPYNPFVDSTGKLTRDGYNFLYNLYLRVGGSLSSLNAATLLDATWSEPNAIGNVTPNTGAFTSLSSTGLQTGTLTSTGATVLHGVTTNSNASAGNIGEYTSATLTSGSSISLTTMVPLTVISLSLTAGDWDVTGSLDFTAAATTSTSYMQGSLSTTNNTLGGANTGFLLPISIVVNSSDASIPLPTIRFSLATTTTIYLVAQAGFTVSTLKTYGTIRARRVR